MKISIKVFLILVLINITNSYSQNKLHHKSFQQFIRKELNKWNIPGAAIAVVKDGKVIYTGGFGYRDKKKKLGVNENTLFAIGSLTKSITATTVGILVDRKFIKWDSKLIDILPNFKLKDPFTTQHINPVDLLCHRSGIPNHNLMWYVTNFSRKEIIHRLQYLEPSSSFRTTFQYNPNMYTLAGYLVEQKSGTTWEKFTSKNIFKPLEMNRSNFTYMDMIKDKNHSKPYIERNGKIIETEFHKSQHFSAPAGSINSSVKEMANWMLMNLNKGKFNNKQVVSTASLSYIQSPHITFPSISPEIGVSPEGNVCSYTTYGLGWNIGTYYDQIILEHLGAIDGFSSQITLLPRLNAGIVVLTNNQNRGDLFTATVINRVTTILMDRKPFNLSEWFSKKNIGSIKTKNNKSLKKKSDTKIIRNLNEYVGEYKDDGYGIIKIILKNNQLQFKYYRYNVKLEHIKNDVFKTIKGIVNRKVNFLSNSNDEINRLEIQWERSIKPIIFYKKKPLK